MKLKIIFSILIIALFSCNAKSKFDINIADQEEIELTVSRFDQELLNADLYNLKSLNKQWIEKYGLLYESFIFQMINSGHTHDPMIGYRLEKFLTDSTIQLIKNEMNTVFSDFSVYEKELQSAFRYYHHYMPKISVPKIVTFYSNFQVKAFPFSDTLGIGLDMFLGRNNSVVNNLPPDLYTQYMKQDMDPELLVTETMKNWIYSQHSKPNEYANFLCYAAREDFLSTLIYHGKMMLLLEATTPEKSSRIRFGYTENEMKWCIQNEKMLYRTLVELKLIYSKETRKILAYVNPGMSTSGLPDDSPGGVGQWIGYRMVKQYFEENKLTLNELLYQKNDARKILSFYTP